MTWPRGILFGWIFSSTLEWNCRARTKLINRIITARANCRSLRSARRFTCSPESLSFRHRFWQFVLTWPWSLFLFSAKLLTHTYTASFWGTNLVMPGTRVFIFVGNYFTKRYRLLRRVWPYQFFGSFVVVVARSWRGLFWENSCRYWGDRTSLGAQAFAYLVGAWSGVFWSVSR